MNKSTSVKNSGTKSPLVTHPPQIPKNVTSKTLLMGLDSLYLGCFGQLHRRFQRLNDSKIKISDVLFTATDIRFGPYKYVFDSGRMTIGFNNKYKYASSPEVYIRLKSQFILSKGLANAYESAIKIADKLLVSRTKRDTVLRVDLFMDILWDKAFKAADVDKFVSRARQKNSHSSNNEITGFSFGKSQIRARVYNKTLEKNKEKSHLLYQAWNIPKKSKSNVWRLEFQLRGVALRKFDVHEFYDLIYEANRIWNYCCQKWLSMRKLNNKRTTRRSLTAFWKTVVDSNFEFNLEIEDEERFEQLTKQYAEGNLNEVTDDSHIVNTISGMVKNHAISHGYATNEEALDNLLPKIEKKLSIIRKNKKRGELKP